MKAIPTIEHGFAIYMDTHLPRDPDPQTEADHRRPFFCGFKACLRAFDVLADLTYHNEHEGDRAWQVLHAEYDRFAQAELEGEHTANH